MNTRGRTVGGNDSIDTGSKVLPWDDERRGVTDMDHGEVDLGLSRTTMLPTQVTNGNQIPYGALQARNLMPERDGDISSAHSGQGSRSLPQRQHHMNPDFMVGQGNLTSIHPRAGRGSRVEQKHQSYNIDQALQTRDGTSDVHPELSHSAIFRDASVQQSARPKHGSNPNHETQDTADRGQFDNTTQLQMGDDEVGDESGVRSSCGQFSTFTVDSHGSSLLPGDSSSGYHTPTSERPDSSSYHRSGGSAVGRASGRGEAVSSLGRQGQEYNPSDMDSQNSIPSHCLMDSLGPRLQASRKTKTKKSEIRQSGTSSRNTDQFIYKRTEGEAGIGRPSSSGATHSHLRSSHGNRGVVTTSTHRKQRKKLKQETYPAEVDDMKKKKMEANMPMFTKRVDPVLLSQHLRGCLKDEQCEHIRKESDLKPKMYVNQTLWNYLKRAPYWWQNLERALEECEYNELLSKLRET